MNNYEQGHDSFSYKTNGRIFVRKAEDIPRVIELMKTIDEYEVDGYMPKDLFYVWDGQSNPELIYTHKFEMDITRLTALCWHNNIWIWCVTGFGYQGSTDYVFKPLPTIPEA